MKYKAILGFVSYALLGLFIGALASTAIPLFLTDTAWIITNSTFFLMFFGMVIGMYFGRNNLLQIYQDHRNETLAERRGKT